MDVNSDVVAEVAAKAPCENVLILGSTSPIARGVAAEFARRGWSLILAARDSEENEAIAQDLRVRFGVDVKTFTWDAADFETHQALVDGCMRETGGTLGGVLWCGGFMEEQSRAQSEWEVAQRTIDVNYSGAVSTLNPFIDHLEKQRRGFLAAVSSVAGDRGRQSNYLYGSAKAGLSAYLEGVRNRLYPAGVSVTTIKPGFVDTSMTWGTVPFAAAPESVARAVVRAIEKKKNTVYVPWFWRYIMLIIRHIPEWQFKRMRM